MLSYDDIINLIDIQGILVKNIETTENFCFIHIELERKYHSCPCCGNKTNTIHDYRKQIVKDISCFGKTTLLIINKRRYRCSCGKRFLEYNSFLPKYYRMTYRFVNQILENLKNTHSFKSVAQLLNISVSTIIRIFDKINYPKPTLSPVLSIDEFKGNSSGEKYHCIITDPDSKKVLDILPTRKYHFLSSYFKTTNKNDVSFFVSDMWKPFIDIAYTFFKNSNKIIDKYHYMRLVIWAFEHVRKQEQQKFCKQYRIYFKRSKSLLTKKYKYLTDEQKIQVNNMLNISYPLFEAYTLKEAFFEIFEQESTKNMVKLFKEWIMYALSSNLNKFRLCAKTFSNWYNEISNSFYFSYTNGFTEGCNNKIKVLKRNAYGYRNFKRFRNRILHMFN